MSKITEVYTIFRCALLEEHVNFLYKLMVAKFPDAEELIMEQLQKWMLEASELHEAMLAKDVQYMKDFERRYEERRYLKPTEG
jgi:hypothetical protein